MNLVFLPSRVIRAISPVIAVLLMIAITVASSLVAYAWIIGYIGTTTTKLGDQIEIQSYAVQGTNLVIYVQNVGEGISQLKPDSSVYVDDIMLSVLKVNGGDPMQTVPLKPGETVSLTVNFQESLSATVRIKVVTIDGGSAQAQGSPHFSPNPENTPTATPSSTPSPSPSPTATPKPITKGLISIAFDDGTQNEYDNAFPIMATRGITGTFFVITDDISDFSHDSSYMSISELQALQSSGNEIGSHSKSHPWFPGLTETEIREQCSVSKQVLGSSGLTVNNFAYPYGGTNDTVNSIVSQYYRSVRTAYEDPYLMPIPTSQIVLTGYAGESNTYLQDQIDNVAATNSWTIIFFHNVVPQYSSPPDPFSISVADFSSFLDYVASKGVQILPVNEALDLANP